MFQRNLYQIVDDLDAIYEFESEALLAYHERLSNYIKQQGYESIAELKAALSKESVEDLTLTMGIVDATADERGMKAMLPDASPEDSFNSLVGAYTTRAVLSILKSVVRERGNLERKSDVSTYEKLVPSKSHS